MQTRTLLNACTVTVKRPASTYLSRCLSMLATEGRARSEEERVHLKEFISQASVTLTVRNAVRRRAYRATAVTPAGNTPLPAYVGNPHQGDCKIEFHSIRSRDACHTLDAQRLVNTPSHTPGICSQLQDLEVLIQKRPQVHQCKLLDPTCPCLLCYKSNTQAQHCDTITG